MPSAAGAALDSGNPATVSLLFPAEQSASAERYVAGILTYPGRYTASAAVRAAQQTAIDQWFAGDDASAATLARSAHRPPLGPWSSDKTRGVAARVRACGVRRP